MTSPSASGGQQPTTPATPPATTPPATPALPDLSGIEQAITALTTFLRNGRSTSDRRPFTPEQLTIENDFRALVRELGRPRKEDLPGRFEWATLASKRLELTAPLPAGMTEIGGFSADRKKIWRIKVNAATHDRKVFRHEDITPVGVVRLRAFDGGGERLIGYPAPHATSSVVR
ncbi:hypothetical protein ACFPK1_15775 [Actinomycetospora rhizophila]|uniref:Uncharacterized protein n=1 Tax=Actinomycetospora rhizophila TaxID=1416876 RepID=A0ABV9ZG27_9PSEU